MLTADRLAQAERANILGGLSEDLRRSIIRRLADEQAEREARHAADRRRAGMMSDRDPLSYRLDHAPEVPDPAGRRHKDKAIIDDHVVIISPAVTKGFELQKVKVRRLADTLTILLRRKTITDDQEKAGRIFQADFHMAALDPTRAANLDRGDGTASAGGVEAMSVAALDARERVNDALYRLGSDDSVAGSMAWSVLGLGKTIKEWAAERAFATGRSIDPQFASGVLVSALGVLAKHYAARLAAGEDV